MFKRFLVLNFAIKKNKNLVCILCQINLTNTLISYLIYTHFSIKKVNVLYYVTECACLVQKALQRQYIHTRLSSFSSQKASIFRVTVVVTPDLSMNTVLSCTLFQGHQSGPNTRFPEQNILMHFFFLYAHFSQRRKWETDNIKMRLSAIESDRGAWFPAA
jgi:hypothetical protein